ncbi:hypothetical protein [Pseudomonas gingeri]|uniref:hypothetical protein n=2 Tax=Pseudomonas gingeri TaxID=117681 RepID=UPI003F7552D7
MCHRPLKPFTPKAPLNTGFPAAVVLNKKKHNLLFLRFNFMTKFFQPSLLICIDKLYRNPHTGEVVETHGANHNRLKAWKEQYDSDSVTSLREI